MLGVGLGRGFGDWVEGGLGGRDWGSVEDIERDGRHGFVGVGEEDADLPHLSVAELGFEGRHSGEADAVLHFPVGFANRIVADAYDIGVALVRLEQLRCVGIHVVADGGWLVVETMAEGAALNVDAGAGGKGGLIRLHVGADHFFLNAGIERDVHQLAFVGKGRIRDRHWDIAIGEVREDCEGNEDNAENESEQESHKYCGLRRFSSYCMEAVMTAKSSVVRPKDVSPVHSRFEMFK